ncbi:MFS transporter [Caenibacillus caldisaponilyticus]|uniref:MFS transporter n=1 Tax=Caenibacillus caldisaponilyticus TaxID=1674942 RepID=UPI0009887EDB|nr:MFS transporter [Caenibacillus caldisaponilyticus]
MADQTVSVKDSRGLEKNALWRLGGAHFLNDLMTTGLVPALLPLYKEAFDLSYTQAGAILLVSNLVSSVMQPVFGLLTDRRPKPWLLPLGTLVTGAGLAATGFVPSFPLLLVAIAISGLGSGLFHPEASRGAHLAAGRAKGTAQAIFQVGGNMGQAFGPLMLPLFLLSVGVKGVFWFLFIGLLGALLTGPLVPWYREKLDAIHRKKAAKPGKKHIPGIIFLTLIVILRSWTQVGVAGFLPFFYLHQHIPLRIGDMLTFLFLLAGALGTFLGGRFSDVLDHKWLLLGSMALTIPFAWLLPVSHGLLAVIILFLFGFLVLSSFAVTVVYGQMMLPDHVGLASGLMIGLGIGAGGIGATFMGWLSDRYGVDFIFHLFLILPLFGALLALFLPSERKLRHANASS